MKGKSVVHSSGKDDWETPLSIVLPLDVEFGLQLDAAADKHNTKLPDFWTKEQDALTQDWSRYRIWCNPPYSQWQKFVKKAHESINLSVLLLPARTDTKAFHNYIYKNPRVEIRFLRGRIKFVGAENGAPFPSMIVIFKEAKEND